MLLFGAAFPVLFAVFGAWSVYRGVHSWNGHAPRPSESVAFAGTSPRIRGFVDRCILPLSLLFLSFGVTLGLAAAAAHTNRSGGLLMIAIAVATTISLALLILSFTVYRYWKPRRLIPAYLRYETHSLPGAATIRR